MGCLLALLLMRWKPAYRIGVLVMLLLQLGGVAGLCGARPLRLAPERNDARRSCCARAMLAVATIGFIRILLVFVLQGVLARMSVPRVLSDVRSP